MSCPGTAEAVVAEHPPKERANARVLRQGRRGVEHMLRGVSPARVRGGQRTSVSPSPTSTGRRGHGRS